MTIQIISKGKKKQFVPHIAVCHMDPLINGGSANEENIPLVQKAANDGKALNAILKALGSDAAILEKASYRNLQKQLEGAIQEVVREENPDREYVWIWVADFDESNAVYEFDNVYKSVPYTVSETGIVELGDEHTEVVAQSVYTSVDGTELVLKGAKAVGENVSESGAQVEAGIASDDNEDENGMSEVILKTKEDVEAFEQGILEKAKAKWEADLAEKELNKSAKEIVKGLGFVEEADQDVIVKALVELGTSDAEVMGVVVKSLTAAQDKVETAEAELQKAKEEFGSAEQTSEEGQPAGDQQSAAEIMKARVAEMKAKQAK